MVLRAFRPDLVIEAGCDGYMAKPIDSNELGIQVADLIRRSRSAGRWPGR